MNTLPSGSTMAGGPRWAGLPPAWPLMATPATGCGRLISSKDALAARVRNQRVAPAGVMSPSWAPAAASCLA